MFSFHREQSEKIMPRATARIQSDLRSKSIKRRGVYAQRDREVAQGWRLPFYTREEKCARQGAAFRRNSLESVVSSEKLFPKRSFWEQLQKCCDFGRVLV
nr:hypothetical protein [Butyricicoccus sp. AF86-03b2A]